MNVRLFSITTVLLFLLGAAAIPVSSSDAQNVDKIAAAGEKPDAGEEPSGKLSKAQGETPEPPSPAQKEFADSLVPEHKSKDAARLKALIAHESLTCFDKSRQP